MPHEPHVPAPLPGCHEELHPPRLALTWPETMECDERAGRLAYRYADAMLAARKENQK